MKKTSSYLLFSLLLFAFNYALWLFYFYTHFYKHQAFIDSFIPFNLSDLLTAVSFVIIGFLLYSFFILKLIKQPLKYFYFSTALLLISLAMTYYSTVIGYSRFNIRYYQFAPLLIVIPFLINTGLPALLLLKEQKLSFNHLLIISFILLPLIFLVFLKSFIFRSIQFFDINWIKVIPLHHYVIAPALIITLSHLLLPYLITKINSSKIFVKGRNILFLLITILSLLMINLIILNLYHQIYYPSPLHINY